MFRLGFSRLWIIALIFFANWAVFHPILSSDYLALDDNQHVTENRFVQDPTFQGLAEIWRQPLNGLYIPLSYSTWALISLLGRKLAGDPTQALGPLSFHLTNFVLHGLNGILVFFLILRVLKASFKGKEVKVTKGITREDLAAVVGSLMFLLHPVQVESVAWVSELKGLLSSFLGLGAILIYFESGRREGLKKRWLYFFSLILFSASLLAKPSSIVLSLLLFCLDVLVLKEDWQKVLKRLSPWFLVSSVAAFITKQSQPTQMLGFLPSLGERILVALDSLSFYLMKLLFPFDLAADYGRTPQYILRNHLVDTSWIGAAIFLLALGVAYRRKSRLFAIGMCFLASVSLNLGLVSFYFQWISTVADRYLYVALVPVALFVAMIWYSGTHWVKQVLSASVLCLAGLSFIQIQYWKENTVFLSHILDVNPRSFVAHSNLGVLYLQRSDVKRAEDEFRKAVALQPGYAICYLNLARALKTQGKVEEAIPHYIKAGELVNQKNWLVNQLSQDERELLSLSIQ